MSIEVYYPKTYLLAGVIVLVTVLAHVGFNHVWAQSSLATVIVEVTNNGELIPLPSANVKVRNSTFNQLVTTGGNGQAIFQLPRGKDYTFEVSRYGYGSAQFVHGIPDYNYTGFLVPLKSDGVCDDTDAVMLDVLNTQVITPSLSIPGRASDDSSTRYDRCVNDSDVVVNESTRVKESYCHRTSGLSDRVYACPAATPRCVTKTADEWRDLGYHTNFGTFNMSACVSL